MKQCLSSRCGHPCNTLIASAALVQLFPACAWKPSCANCVSRTPLQEGLLDTGVLPGMACACLFVFILDSSFFFASAISVCTSSLRGLCGTCFEGPGICGILSWDALRRSAAASVVQQYLALSPLQGRLENPQG